ncbi:hypothetical protein R5R35_011088 [Gryllus longicercus]|uniref:COMM domain-containing protein n=1 Tax=Gryllus longicercus TaxID=2509291 RepID=A0AAN9VXP9_9ORTH|nr:COMM domain-containing protein 10 [Gryllus bimaculatus]
MSWITATPRLQRAVEIINNLDSSKFPLLLNRIAQALQAGSGGGKVFTDEEEEKLQASLNLDHDSLKLLLESTSYIIEQAAYHMTKPAVFHHSLLETLKMNKDKAQTFVNTWSNTAKGIVEQLRKKSLFPAQLEDIKWSLRLQTSSSTHGRQAVPKAVFQFGIKENDSVNNVTVDFNHNELFEFYKKIEKIQAQLDNLK